MRENIFEVIIEWQKKTFPNATALSKAHHLKIEVDELINDLSKDVPHRRLEYADCFLLLFGSAASDGMSYEDICLAIWDKMEINLKRKWGVPDENGVVNHVKEPEPDDDDEIEFTSCDNCDGHDACEDFGCAIALGIKIKPPFLDSSSL